MAHHCPECGFVNAEGANYCQKCGAFVGAPEQPKDPVTATYRIDERARAVGARGGKALGASGGGCVLIIASDDSVDRVKAAVTELAPDIMPIAIDEVGFTCMRISDGDQS